MKVCLIGNNLTSLILANILSKKNFYCEIYSSNSRKSSFNTRSLGITNHNLTYLSKYLKKISKKTNYINEIKVFIKNKKTDEKIIFNHNSETLFNMIKYSELFSYLKSNISKDKNILFKNYNKKLNLLKLSDDKKFKMIICCESSNILTHKYLKNKISKNYFNKAFTTIIEHKKIKNNKAVQIFTEFGPIAFLPLSTSNTSVVFSFELNNKKNISENDIVKIIKKFNPYYKIKRLKKLENFNLSMKLPKNYYYKNTLFFGDSIHSIHPLAGQGFNMTIRDIIKLEEIIDQKINLGLDIDKNIYQEFEKKAKSYNSLFSHSIDFVHEFLKFNKDYVPNIISKKLFAFINNNQNLKEVSIKFANKGVL